MMPAYHNLDFASVQVRHLETSAQFYRDILGFEAVEEQRSDAVVFKNGAGAIFAIRTPMRPLPEEGALGIGASLWFDTADVDSLYQRLLDAEATVLAKPDAGPFGRQMTCLDPDGYVLVFHQHTNNQ